MSDDWPAWPRVTEVIREAGLMDTSRYTTFARDRGRAVHAATQYLDDPNEGELDESSLDPRVLKRVYVYRSFLAEVEPEILGVEQEVRHSGLQYKGRLDRIVRIGEQVGVLDIKGEAQEHWHGLQLAAYAGALKDTGPSRLRLEVGRWSLHLSDDSYRLVTHTNRDDWPAFCGALSLYYWRKHRGLIRNRHTQTA